MKVALLGNPNAGKTSIFNYLTGMNQKVGNFPGVTVEKKMGTYHLSNQQKASIIDLPGTYSLYPKSLEEEVVLEILLNKEHPEHPDLLVVVVDASNLKRNLLLFTQLHDLGIPTILVFNMIDAARKAGLHFDKEVLEKAFNTTIVFTNARTEEGLATLAQQVVSPKDHHPTQLLLPPTDVPPALLKEVQQKYKLKNAYWSLLLVHHFEKLSFLSEQDKSSLEHLSLQHGFKSLPAQSKETIQRYELISKITANGIKKKEGDSSEVVLNKELDILFLHPVGGYLIFFSILFLMFQAIYTLADHPIQWIEQLFAWIGTNLNKQLPDTPLTDLFTDGILAGIGGVVVFVPQIAILFGIIAILEETGYMTRVMLLMDKLMQKFGLNGRSVVPLISGVACAIPAIMSTRNIDNWKERFITIMVTPLMSCSARLPIYTVIIGLLIPEQQIAGVFNLRGLVLMGLYLLGLVMALIIAFTATAATTTTTTTTVTATATA
ncbi:MAG: ferrous iron transport protein B, partial [Bacteroidota bacterium]